MKGQHPEESGRDDAPRRAAAEIEGIVTAQLPSGLYRVDVDGAHITAHAGGGLERNFVRLLVGDRVLVQLAERDRTRGRIVKRAQ